ncbi:hypothetical protein ACQKM1_26430 [Peribacillus frigoritolerans]|uniref:hypothetical protein n=1 Tax=Peribacillus frigoritolerans TaxID=450367 RepID=UPI003CFF0119
MKKFLGGFALVMGLSIVLPITSYADSNESVKIEKKNGKVTFDVQEKGDSYKFYKDNVLVYEGNSNSYKANIDSEVEKYKVGIYNNNELDKVIALKVSDRKSLSKTKSFSVGNQEDFVNKTVQNTKLDTVVEEGSVTLNWPEIPDEDKVYEIFKDDEKIGETTELKFVDKNIQPGNEYTYTVQVENKLSPEAQKEVEAKADAQNLNIPSQEMEEIQTYDGTIATLVAIPENTEESLKNDAIMDPIVESKSQQGFLPDSNEFSFNYRTFIPYVSVKNPNPISGTQYLKGDNRSFAVYSDKYRTESAVYAMFKNPTALTLYKDVKESFSCSTSTCSSPKSIGTASDSGITISKYNVTSTRLSWSVNHAVRIPLASYYPKIDYYYLAIMTPSSFSASGELDKAPNHEFYMTYPTGYKTIKKHAVTSPTDFLKLFGIQTSWSFDM